MAFTDNGYDVIKFRDIQEGIRANLEAALGTPISSDPDTVIGIINSIFANEVSTVENNIQALVSNLSVLTAEGVYLDELVRYIGISRRSAQSASGSLKVWRNGIGLVPTSLLFSTTVDERFLVPSGLTHSLSSCAELLLSPETVSEGVEYTITVGTTILSYTALLADTATEVVDHFKTELINQFSYNAFNESDKLRFYNDDEDLNNLSIELTNFTINEIAVFTYAESVDKKDLVVIENTITEVVTTNSNILRSNNPLPFVDGSATESDEELRARHQQSIQIGGNATVPAITAKLLQVSGVTQAFIVENTTILEDLEGRPAKSYESFVLGGDPNQIGQVIWDSKPAGVETYGDITTAVTDVNGLPQSVNWSRPEPIYIFVKVTYKLYDEEVFPANGGDLIKQAVKDFGDNLDIGKDIINTRFVGSIYSSVNGVDEISIEIGSSTDIGDSSPVGGYTTTTIPVSRSQTSDFSLSRVSTVQLP